MTGSAKPVPAFWRAGALSLGMASAAVQAAAVADAPPLLPPAPAGAVHAWQLFTILGYLAALGLIAYVGLRWWKRRSGTPAWAPKTRQIVVSESRRISASASAAILEVRGTAYLVVLSPSAVAIQALPEKQP